MKSGSHLATGKLVQALNIPPPSSLVTNRTSQHRDVLASTELHVYVRERPQRIAEVCHQRSATGAPTVAASSGLAEKLPLPPCVRVGWVGAKQSPVKQLVSRQDSAIGDDKARLGRSPNLCAKSERRANMKRIQAPH